MIFYTITDTLPVVPDWSSITGDLKAGTPISIKGAVANDEAAIGLVAGDTAHGAEYAVVVTAGVVDLNAAAASYGSTVSDDVVQALDNITFIYGGKVYAVSSLPDYSQARNGDVLVIEDGAPAWSREDFFVSLTPTALDLSGTMDKTVAEIHEAIAQDKNVWFRVDAQGWKLYVRVGEVNYADGVDYPSINAVMIVSSDVTGSGPALLRASTGVTNDGTNNTYYTELYPLTPAT